MYLFYLYIYLVDNKKLFKYAIDYLSKYDSSKKNLADVLKRKVFKLKIQKRHTSKNLIFIVFPCKFQKGFLSIIRSLGKSMPIQFFVFGNKEVKLQHEAKKKIGSAQ